jgi:serine/threonine protein kinase
VTPKSEIYRFGDFELDATELVLRRKGSFVPLTRKATHALLLLIQNGGAIVLRQEMMEALWPDVVVEEANLTVTIHAIRKALGKGPDGQQYIQTVAGRGYRFAIEVNRISRHQTPFNVNKDPYRRIGGQLAARYELLEYAGGGGMGAVYSALDLTEERIVAVKILKPDIAARNPEYVELFATEVRTAQELKHPHIVQILDSGTDEETPFMVMEWIEGKSIEDVVSMGMLSLRRIKHVFAQICSAVSFAHKNNIIHLDIKPANVLMQTVDFAKVIDFGLSRVLSRESGTTVTKFRGTHQYCAPEQFGGKVNYRSDIYSLGATLYHIITGVVPFSTSYIYAKMYPNMELPQLSSLTNYRDIPSAVDLVISKALNKDPQKRQKSVEELFEEFSNALKSPQEAGLHERESLGQVSKYDRPFMADPLLSTFATQFKDSDECEFDENGECVNQMHWGANE